MTLEVRHLKLVHAVAASGGLTSAGRHLHLSQSALSHQLHDVEQRLGTRLFLRVGKRMVLTAAGTRLLQSAEEVLDLLKRTEDDVRGLAAGRHGLIRISAGRYTGYQWLPQVLKMYRPVHPEIDIRVERSGMDDPVRLLIDGVLDVAIVGETTADARVVSHVLFEDTLVLLVDSQHPLAPARCVRPEEFLKHPLLLESPRTEHRFYRTVVAGRGLRPTSVEYIAEFGALIELVKAGLGVAVLPRWVADPYVETGGLAAVPLTAETSRHAWRAVVLKDMDTVQHIRRFVEAMAAARRGSKNRLT